jgi:hypothetical protein
MPLLTPSTLKTFRIVQINLITFPLLMFQLKSDDYIMYLDQTAKAPILSN